LNDTTYTGTLKNLFSERGVSLAKTKRMGDFSISNGNFSIKQEIFKIIFLLYENLIQESGR
jgi:hypothetical protein